MDTEREDAIHKAGLEVMYAQNVGDHYETWQYYVSGMRSELPDFYSLEGLHSFAVRYGYGIIYV